MPLNRGKSWASPLPHSSQAGILNYIIYYYYLHVHVLLLLLLFLLRFCHVMYSVVVSYSYCCCRAFLSSICVVVVEFDELWGHVDVV